MRIAIWVFRYCCLYFFLINLPVLAEINGSDSSRKNIIVTSALDAGGFITTEKKAHLSGIRVEADEPGEDGFIGYTEKGISIVRPDTVVRVVLFGWWLDEVMLIGFTPNDNCSNTVANYVQAEFTIQTEKRVVVRHAFHQAIPNTLFKICIKQKPRETHSEIEMPFTLVDDLRSSISTDLPPRKYYFPIAAQIAIVVGLLVLSGLFSGLNLGLMALTPQELMLISKSGSKQERKYAETILPVRKSGNLLLCSLLIGNVCVNSAISILFDDLTSGYVALIVASLGIVVFGEIFPQALCVKKGLAVGAVTINITRFFMIVTFPLAFPISKILDCILGVEVVSYDRKRIMELIKMSTRSEAGLAEELKIAVGAMEISDKTVSDVMTKIDDVFMLPDTTVLNTKTVAEILRMGYTRIPVYSENRNNVVSLLFVKDLALLDPDDNFTVKMVCGYHDHQLRFVLRDTPLRVMLEEFKKGDYHLALVEEIVQHNGSDPVTDLAGIVTLEDILEEILQAEIVDETDAITDNVHRIRRRRAQEHEFSHCLLDNDPGACLISMQMQLVTIQWLATNHAAFSQEYIGHSTLEKVIRQHVHKVELSHLADINDPKMVYPRTAKLYTKKEASDKFILILEGRAIVTIGQNAMTFEAGPWHCFGNELLDRVFQLVQQQQAVPSKALNTRNSQGALSVATSVAVVAAPPQPVVEPDPKKITFVPDYSAVIRDDCTYLEISAQTYLLAYKSTLLSRQKNENAGVADSQVVGTGQPTEIPVNQITSEGFLEEVALLRSNGSLRKKIDDMPRKRTNSHSNSENARLVDQDDLAADVLDAVVSART
ncbi:metal transporter cnnm-1 [Ditylenchus destructor]|uniref:Metal transporter cnnm-1 n=1 Tax=Ditylenchus destructor TaxID=166010 RepID=A0AAD4R8I3_9BILA|nr:metal transporter cnnm-1 [Ditylenchus destructor]